MTNLHPGQGDGSSVRSGQGDGSSVRTVERDKVEPVRLEDGSSVLSGDHESETRPCNSRTKEPSPCPDLIPGQKNRPRVRSLADWLEMLPQADVEQAVVLLGKIERFGPGHKGVALQLIPLLNSDDFRLRARTFTCLGRLGDIEAGEELIRFLQTEPREEWQIWAVETLHHLMGRSGIKPPSDLLDDHEKAIPMRWIKPLSCFLDDPEKPILVRACLWLIGALGGREAVEVIASFLSRSAGRLVKDEVALEALQMAVSSCQDGHAYLKTLQAAAPAVDRAMRYALLPSEKPRFRVLPYPDYFLDQAKENGLNPESFRRLLFWDRS